MKDYRIDFTELEWKSPIEGVREKVIIQDSKRFRLVEYSPNMPPHWCERGHFGYIIEGRFEIEFKDGIRVFGQGDGICIPSGEIHKARAITDLVQAAFVEDEQ